MTTRRLPGLVLALTLGVLSTFAAAQAPPSADERALTALVERWVDARNANDAEAMRPLFAERIDRVMLPKGVGSSTTRDEFIKYFADGFKGDAKGTHAKTLQIRPLILSADSGLVDHTYTMHNPDGSEIGLGSSTFIAQKQGGEWRTVALRVVSAWPSQR